MEKYGKTAQLRPGWGHTAGRLRPDWGLKGYRHQKKFIHFSCIDKIIVPMIDILVMVVICNEINHRYLSGKMHFTVYICHPLIPSLLLVFMCSLLTGMRSSLTIPPSETAKAGNVAAVRTKYLKFNGHCLEFYYTNIQMWGNLSVISIAENQQRDTVLVLTDSWNMKRAFVKLQDGTQRLEIRFERAHMRFSLKTSITGVSIWPCFEFSKC